MLPVMYYSILFISFILYGLAGAGKTTLLYKCMKDENETIAFPTIMHNVETVDYENVRFIVWEIGACNQITQLYRRYHSKTNGVVMVIDSSERQRLDEFGQKILKPIRNAPEFIDSVFLFLLNKTDLPNTLNKDEVTARLDLESIKQTWKIFETCFTEGYGVKDALDWLDLQLRGTPPRTSVVD